VDELYAEIGRLTTQLTWLEKKLPASLIGFRRALIEGAVNTLPVRTQGALARHQPDASLLSADAAIGP